MTVQGIPTSDMLSRVPWKNRRKNSYERNTVT